MPDPNFPKQLHPPRDMRHLARPYGSSARTGQPPAVAVSQPIGPVSPRDSYIASKLAALTSAPSGTADGNGQRHPGVITNGLHDTDIGGGLHTGGLNDVPTRVGGYGPGQMDHGTALKFLQQYGGEFDQLPPEEQSKWAQAPGSPGQTTTGGAASPGQVPAPALATGPGGISRAPATSAPATAPGVTAINPGDNVRVNGQKLDGNVTAVQAIDPKYGGGFGITQTLPDNAPSQTFGEGGKEWVGPDEQARRDRVAANPAPPLSTAANPAGPAPVVGSPLPPSSIAGSDALATSGFYGQGAQTAASIPAASTSTSSTPFGPPADPGIEAGQSARKAVGGFVQGAEDTLNHASSVASNAVNTGVNAVRGFFGDTAPSPSADDMGLNYNPAQGAPGSSVGTPATPSGTSAVGVATTGAPGPATDMANNANLGSPDVGYQRTAPLSNAEALSFLRSPKNATTAAAPAGSSGTVSAQPAAPGPKQANNGLPDDEDDEEGSARAFPIKPSPYRAGGQAMAGAV